MAEPLLGQEKQFFEAERVRLLAEHEGKFALIKGSRLVGIFDTQKAAYEEGLKQLGNVAMLIVRIARDQPVEMQSPALTLGLLNARPYS